MPSDLILGTAGHIDHGKTALVKALTGVDTDRLPEEKRRGITIDLGFAELPLGDFRLGVVDVPGHEKFVRNMLAGATGIDLALLVVAADDSVKPQTREHLEILRQLELEHGAIAISKCDLADPAWLELVEDEIRQLVKGTFLANAPIIRTSVKTGAGLPELTAALRAAAEKAVPSDRRLRGGDFFRLAIDRAFTVSGHGTVVTGSVGSGRCRVEDELKIEPGGTLVRVRGLESHGRPVEELHRGQRGAVNITGVHYQDLIRGQELASPGYLVPSKCLSARVQMSAAEDVQQTRSDPPRHVLKHRARVRLHLGTAEIAATVLFMNRDSLRTGETGYAQLLLERPAVATFGQPFILRRESPARTLGGGRVLDPEATKLRTSDEAGWRLLQHWDSADERIRTAAAIESRAWRDWTPNDLVRLAGVANGEEVFQRLCDAGEVVELADAANRRKILAHRDVLEKTGQHVEALLARLHHESPLCAAFPIQQIAARLARIGLAEKCDILLKWMEAAGRVVLTQQGVALKGRTIALTKLQQDLIGKILAIYRTAGFQPPTTDSIVATFGGKERVVNELLAMLVAQNQLVKISKEFFLLAADESKLRALVTNRLSGGEGITVGAVCEFLNTTRKYGVPFCEYLDRVGVTVRRGDLRYLRAQQ